MVERGNDGDGSIADLPWASVFDPMANMRALTDIQTRGFRAATEIVNRFVSAAGSGPERTQDAGAEHPAGEPANGSSVRPEVDRAVATWQSLVAQLAGSLRAPVSPAGVATFDLAGADANRSVYLETGEDGQGEADVWLHNGSTTDLGQVRVRCSDLLSHDGSVIVSTAVYFEPGPDVDMPQRTSRGLVMKAKVAQDAVPGLYRGTLLADGHPDVWMSVLLSVRPQT